MNVPPPCPKCKGNDRQPCLACGAGYRMNEGQVFVTPGLARDLFEGNGQVFVRYVAIPTVSVRTEYDPTLDPPEGQMVDDDELDWSLL